jgi:hypothetical protein
MVPRRSGCSGSWEPTKNAEGWASLGKIGNYNKKDDLLLANQFNEEDDEIFIDGDGHELDNEDG